MGDSIITVAYQSRFFVSTSKIYFIFNQTVCCELDDIIFWYCNFCVILKTGQLTIMYWDYALTEIIIIIATFQRNLCQAM